MSINRKNELDKSVFGDYSHSVMYPWKKLHKLGYDNLWVDANSDHPPGILRYGELKIFFQNHSKIILINLYFFMVIRFFVCYVFLLYDRSGQPCCSKEQKRAITGRAATKF